MSLMRIIQVPLGVNRTGLRSAGTKSFTPQFPGSIPRLNISQSKKVLLSLSHSLKVEKIEPGGGLPG